MATNREGRAPVASRRPRPNLNGEAATYIRDQILSGTLRPGQKIQQDTVAEELGISRLPVREALIQLAGDGLVINIPRRGSYVADLAPGDIHDHYEMLGLLSGMAAQRAAAQLDDQALARLEASIQRMRETQDAHELDNLNFEFHREINRAGNSRRLAAVLRSLSESMPTRFFEYNQSFEPQSIAEHQHILASLKRRDGDAAAKAMGEHFRNVGDQAVNMLKARDFWAERGDEISAPDPDDVQQRFDRQDHRQAYEHDSGH